MKDRDAWRAAVHVVSKSRTWLSDSTTKNKHKIPVAPLCMRVQWDSKHIQGRYAVSTTESGKHWQLVIEPEHVSKAKRNQQSYEKHERPRNPVILFLTHVNPCISHHLHWKRHRERKKRQVQLTLKQWGWGRELGAPLLQRWEVGDNFTVSIHDSTTADSNNHRSCSIYLKNKH